MQNPIATWINAEGTGPQREDLLPTEHGRLILTSWLATRVAVGILGIAMPLVLMVPDIFRFEGAPWARGSLSAYYHSGTRDLFVGILCVVGVFLLAYRLSERDPDNRWTSAAGLAAITVALFPTYASDGQALTPLQEWFGETRTAWVHGLAAGTFLICLAVVSLRFAKRDDKRGHPRYAAWHRWMGATMLAACAALVALKLVGVEKAGGGFTVLLLVEIVSTWAFGVSWLLKGYELRTAIQSAERRDRANPASAEVAVASSWSRAVARLVGSRRSMRARLPLASDDDTCQTDVLSRWGQAGRIGSRSCAR